MPHSLKIPTFLLLFPILVVVSPGPGRGETEAAQRPGLEHRQDLLRMLSSGKVKRNTILVHHLGRNATGQQVAESAHFRIIHNQSKAQVEHVARTAERLRLVIHRQWFGNVSLEWDGKCVIYLHPSFKKYRSKTKLQNTVGHARTLMLGENISQRSMHLPWGLPDFFDDILPHELTHTVMAVRFRGRLPRWANEAMAMLAESPASIEDRRKTLEDCRRKDDLFSVEVLMKTEESAQINTLEYYAQTMSLVRYFVAERGRQAFTKFLGDSMVVGYESSLKKHYGISSFAELERRWLKYAFSTPQQAPEGFAGLPRTPVQISVMPHGEN